MMRTHLLNCLITLTFIASVKAIIFRSTDTSLVSEVVTVQHVSSSYEHRHRRSAEGTLPVELNFRFSSKGSDINLRLKRSVANQPSDIPVYVIRRNAVVKENLPPIQNAASYLDQGMGATILVTRRNDGNFTLEGTFYDSRERVHIHPSDGPIHEISRAAEVNYGNDYIVNSEGVRRSPVETHGRSKRNSINEYTIRILMCADHKDYSHWKRHFKNETLVKNGMRQYYAIVAQSMSLRYASVTDVDPNLKINIHITGLLIIDNRGKSYWTENEATENGTVEVQPALRSFKEWVRSQNTLPPSNHWMLFSGYDLVSNGSKIVAGLATLAALCTQSSMSIIEQDFSASVGATASHELGHILSAFHDGGPMATTCPDSDNYIMSSRLVNPTENATASRPWEFSRCSVRAFRRFLARVYCARKPVSTTSPFDSPDIDVTNLKAGQVYSSDVQCRLSLGNESYFGRGIQYNRGFDSMCRAMYCAIPGRPKFFQKMFAMEKTTCGDGKWCVKGRCIADPKAPRTPEFCPQGDAPDENCKLEDCPFRTKTGKIRYCCTTCGITPEVVLQTLPPDSQTTTTYRPSYYSLNTTDSYQQGTTSAAIVRPSDENTHGSAPNDIKSPTTTQSSRSTIFGNMGPKVFAIMNGVFSRLQNLLDGSGNGADRAGNGSTIVVASRMNNASTNTPNAGNWLSPLLSNRKPNQGRKKIKLISFNPRPISSGLGTSDSLFSDQSGFSWSLSENPSPSPARALFDNRRQPVDSIPGDVRSIFRWVGNARPLSTTVSDVRPVNRPLDPIIALPRITGNSRITSRWRSTRPTQRTTSSDSGSGVNTITVTQADNRRTFCVSCTSSWSSSSGVITRPQPTVNMPSDTGISWLRRGAIRSVSGTNANSDNFRILTIPRIIQG